LEPKNEGKKEKGFTDISIITITSLTEEKIIGNKRESRCSRIFVQCSCCDEGTENKLLKSEKLE